MKKLLFTFLFLSQSLLAFSQFYNDFSDGDFTNNPSRNGDSLKFVIDSLGILHHKKDTSNGEYTLFIESKLSQNAMWQFKTHYDFAPSTSNYAKVYLMSDIKYISNTLNSYFVKIGEVSGLIDDISLYLQKGGVEIKIIDGEDGTTERFKQVVVLSR